MARYNVSFEINIDALNPLSAAVEVQNMIDLGESKWQFFVQEEGKEPIFSVDLEDLDSQLSVVSDYIPNIKTKCITSGNFMTSCRPMEHGRN